MKVRGNPCTCAARFLNQYPEAHVRELDGLRYEDETCYVECSGGVITAHSYEVVNGKKYKDGECVVSIW